LNQRTHDPPVSTSGNEWFEAQLIDRAERAEAEAATLRADLERRETELLIARLWVKELALWLEEATQGDRTWPVSSLAVRLSPQAGRASHERLETPHRGRRLATVAAMVATPWLALSALAYAVYALGF
jgi:hypothetical protein